MAIVICPGFHPPSLTDCFLDTMELPTPQLVCTGLPLDGGSHVREWVKTWGNPEKQTDKITVISYSAGSVGAIAACWLWHQLGGQIQALIALDAWGVVLMGPFPIYRVSHDYFTHWSSSVLGLGDGGFYADPGVDHQQLWRSPHQAIGYRQIYHQTGWEKTTARDFIQSLC
ncbi:hypothetical protein [Roseofilum capinflatum]|uniref:Alpha/beta hydrolase n=1 Tax=Roseofilum capinflatum BLCC-M114 TaxID=3022440 RepID=A0ABT7B4F9_9CYAN|nr:hypothetical protein [Roseofilum capinflatum]MDJ1174062.1 hypothetical protein [Roseofilum capinflatum BLCC-M114]